MLVALTSRSYVVTVPDSEEETECKAELPGLPVETSIVIRISSAAPFCNGAIRPYPERVTAIAKYHFSLLPRC